jgi:hypothetical protein
VRLPKQNTPAALMSCLLEEDEDTLIEEDEDAIVEVAPAEASGDMTLGGLMNVDPTADEVDDKEDYVIVKLKGESEWTLLPASSIGGGGYVTTWIPSALPHNTERSAFSTFLSSPNIVTVSVIRTSLPENSVYAPLW